MVRLIIPAGKSIEIQGGDPGEVETIEGPMELVFEVYSIGGDFVSSGEYLLVGADWLQLLPYLREELAIALPVALVVSLLIALTWLRRHV